VVVRLTRLRALLDHPVRGRFAKFLISSGVAAGTSAVVLAGLYAMHVDTTVATILAFFAGAVPNWSINRRWTWKVRGRVAFGREIFAYLVISGITLVLLSLATNEADTFVKHQHIREGTGLRVLIVTGSYFLTLALLYGVRFFLYEKWIFSGRSRVRAALRSRRQVWSAARANRSP
jgi:putative flippase GtrA